MMVRSNHDRYTYTLTATVTLVLLATATFAQDQPPNPKRGISWIGTTSAAKDNRLLAATNTSLSWYKSWGAQPLSSEGYLSNLEFVPMIHSLDNLDGDIASIRGLRGRDGKAVNVLTFNEPDGDTAGGGTAISAGDAAEAWEKVVALRSDERRISSPATTGSPHGFEWLQAWNASCWERYEDVGCEFDFVAAHWYGAFDGMASWLGQLHEAWPDKEVWVTEFALPQPASEGEVVGMMNQSLGWMDETEWVARYAWFGAFREDEANGWTGGVVSLFDDEGGLTELGSLYMGGEKRGFEVGESAGGENAAGRAGLRSSGAWVALVVGLGVMVEVFV